MKQYKQKNQIIELENINTQALFIGTQSEFKRMMGGNRGSNISGLVNNKVYVLNGWKLKDFERPIKESKQYKFKCIEDENIFIGSRQDFVKFVGTDNGKITKLLKGDLKHIKGWIINN